MLLAPCYILIFVGMLLSAGGMVAAPVAGYFLACQAVRHRSLADTCWTIFDTATALGTVLTPAHTRWQTPCSRQSLAFSYVIWVHQALQFDVSAYRPASIPYPYHTPALLGRRVFLTEVRLTETSESERRQHSGFWRESVIGRVLAWVPGLAREPEGDVKKARPPKLTRVLRAQEEVACL